MPWPGAGKWASFAAGECDRGAARQTRRLNPSIGRPECEAQVKGASGAKYKGFPTHDQAHEYIKQLNWDYKVQHEKAQRQLPPSTPVQSSSGNGSSSQDAIIVDDEEGEPLEQEAGPSRHRESDSNQEECSELKKQIVSGKVSSGKKAKREKNSRRIAALEESLRQASERIAALESGSQQSSGYDTTLDVKSKSSSIRSAAQLDVGSSQTSKRSAVSGASSYQSKKKPRINVDSQESSSSPCTDLVVHKSSQVRTIEVYTDGACTDNGKYSARAGWGVYWPEGQGDDLIGLNESKRLPGNRSQQTNNRAEFMGLIRAVQLCPDPDAQLVIYTDSAYCINGEQGRRSGVSGNLLTQCPFAAIEKWQGNWRRNGWLLSSTQTPVLNKDLIRLLERELRGRRLRPILRKVKGHSNNKGNCMADK